jgi:hypothetical protein
MLLTGTPLKFRFLMLAEQRRYVMPPLGWIGVTHTCRRWRQIALHDSTLWSRVSASPCAGGGRVPRLLFRARNVLLVIDTWAAESA